MTSFPEVNEPFVLGRSSCGPDPEAIVGLEGNRRPMPRLFTGLELPDAVVSQLALMRGEIVGARWIEPESYHIALRFIGDVDGAVAATSRDVSDVRRPTTPVHFEGLSWFGGDKPRAIVAKVKAEPALIDLQAEQERGSRRVGIEPETRRYTPT